MTDNDNALNTTVRLLHLRYENVNMIVKLIACLFLIIPLYAQRVSTELYSNGKVRSQGMFNGAQKIGEWKYFYPNGTQMAIENFENGFLNGGVFYFFPDGSIQAKEHWEMGTLND